MCHAIAKRAPDVLQKLAASIMPLAFLGMHDASGTTKALWQELWDDNTPGMEGGVQLYTSTPRAPGHLGLPHTR